ncbi:hypothetical protein C8J57DRAFT_1297132 [Mycena rebaudengoi]|nr:hypothetical protein C8J57DRAFT_1297132 [Mycena rebaudengoi]
MISSDAVSILDHPNHLVPGTPTFFPALLGHVRDVALPSMPIDAVVFQSILLCLVSGDKHLLLRAPEQDVRLVGKLAFLALSSVFGLATHKLKIRPRSGSPAHAAAAPGFLRSLFHPWGSHDNQTSQDEAASSGKASLVSRHRTRNNATWKRSSSGSKPRQMRSMSNPNDLNGGTTTSNPFGDQHEIASNPFSTFTSASKPSNTRTRGPLPHSFSDPTPLRPKADDYTLRPQALRALTRVLAEKRVVLEDDGFSDEDGYDEVWNLPEGFIMVYVCPIDAHERPTIHKTLLDKFAMSATVSPHHSLRALLLSPSRNSNSYRNSPALHSSPLPQPGTPTSSPSFPGQPIPLPHHSHSYPLTHLHHHHPLPQNPLVPPALLRDLRAAYRRTHLSPLLDLYASDLFSAARHHSQLDGTLLTAKSKKDAIDLARAGRVIGGDLTGIELLREDAAYAATKSTAYKENGNGNVRQERNEGEDVDPGTPEPIGNGHANGTVHRYQPIEVVVEEPDVSTPQREDHAVHAPEGPAVLEVSEADIARIVPRVMTHRVCVRRGPQDEVLGSARYPAVPLDGREDGGVDGTGRITIKEILVRILADCLMLLPITIDFVRRIACSKYYA